MSHAEAMRRTIGLLLATGLAALAAGTAAPAATHGAQSPAHAVCKQGYYKNVSGRCVRRPTKAPTAPPGATAKCRDGSYSFSQHASGTCSHHGGVARWIRHP